MPAKPKRISNRRALASARRYFLAEPKPMPEPLSSTERSELFDLMDDAHASNHRLLNADRELIEARDAFAVAKGNLEIAEADLAHERAENQRLHAKLAPLFHRLTTPKP